MESVHRKRCRRCPCTFWPTGPPRAMRPVSRTPWRRGTSFAPTSETRSSILATRSSRRRVSARVMTQPVSAATRSSRRTISSPQWLSRRARRSSPPAVAWKSGRSPSSRDVRRRRRVAMDRAPMPPRSCPVRCAGGPDVYPQGPRTQGREMNRLDKMTTAEAADGSSHLVLTVLLTAVAYFMVTLDALVVVTALPSIHRSIGGGIATLQWTVSAYTIAFGAGILTASALGDRLGRRRVYVAGLVLFTLASAACALAPDASVLICFRAIQGIGAAIVMPLSLTILTSAFPVEKRGAVVGIWGGIAGLAVAAGPLIGGGITQGLDWHWIF